MLFAFLQGQIGFAYMLAWLLAVAVAITVHEFAHAWRADRAGDPTPRLAGRLSLYPWVHYDPLGSTLFLLFGLGWAKPVPITPALFKKPRYDGIMVALWGPLSNLITATAFALPIRLGIGGIYTGALQIMVIVNLLLALFNLLPIHPLDGSHILGGLLPRAKAYRFELFMRRWGLLVIALLIFTPLLRIIIFLPLGILYGLLTGEPSPLRF